MELGVFTILLGLAEFVTETRKMRDSKQIKMFSCLQVHSLSTGRAWGFPWARKDLGPLCTWTQKGSGN
jgi:hypothetical protein